MNASVLNSCAPVSPTFPVRASADIAARFCGVDVEVRGASGKELRDWLWDYDAHPLTEQERTAMSALARTGKVGLTGAQLFKTDAFMAAQPFGNVPAAFGPDG
ncbi:MAG: hypothetical protein ACK463_47840, partial [Bradyrhizobium sp.]